MCDYNRQQKYAHTQNVVGNSLNFNRFACLDWKKIGLYSYAFESFVCVGVFLRKPVNLLLINDKLISESYRRAQAHAGHYSSNETDSIIFI